MLMGPYRALQGQGTDTKVTSAKGPPARLIRRRENMVGVNMVLAELAKFEHGLYKSCGIVCVEGIMLQPCFHVAGTHASWPSGNMKTVLRRGGGGLLLAEIMQRTTPFIHP